MEQEEWYQRIWRPALAFLFIAACAFDLIVAPAAIGILSSVDKMMLWTPNIFKHNGLFLYMVAPVLGLYVWKRSVEKQLRIRHSYKMAPRAKKDPDDPPTLLHG